MRAGLGVSVVGCGPVWADMGKGGQRWAGLDESDWLGGDGWHGQWVDVGMRAGLGLSVGGCGAVMGKGGRKWVGLDESDWSGGDGWHGYWIGVGMRAGLVVGRCGWVHRLVIPLEMLSKYIFIFFCWATRHNLIYFLFTRYITASFPTKTEPLSHWISPSVTERKTFERRRTPDH